MLQSPYFFFDVVYLHNGVEEQGDETNWRVSGAADGSYKQQQNAVQKYSKSCSLNPWSRICSQS